MTEESATGETAFDIKNLDTPSIGKLWNKGILFSIEPYQRGYRWKRQQVMKLLEDILLAAESKNPRPYMLQPVVLREHGTIDWKDGTKKRKFELIDGQQRLTCLWIVAQYLAAYGFANFKNGIYVLDYATRESSGEFLRKLAEGNVPEPTTIDEEHFAQTFEWAKEFFGKCSPRQKFDWSEFLEKEVFVIWYVADEALSKRTAEDIFMSLNRGRIPLTDSELVKTLLLVRSMKHDPKTNEIQNQETQTEIGTEWDEMERRLADEDFWAFIAGDHDTDGKPRMDYLLSVLPKPGGKEWSDEFDDDYKVFNRYSGLVDSFSPDHFHDSGKPRYPNQRVYVLEALWRRHIRASFLKLLDWSRDSALFHKLGFLIAVQKGGAVERGNLLRDWLAMDCPNWQIEKAADGKIKKLYGQAFKRLDELGYTNAKDKQAMEDLLLLFNVITCMDEARKANSRMCERYSFARHFDSDSPWSLEHINPQKEMRNLTGKQKTKRSDWHKWLKSHIAYLDVAKDRNVAPSFEDLKKRVQRAVDGGEERLTEETFRTLYEEIVSVFNAGFDPDREHKIGNMALLRQYQNASLGPSAFIVKRSRITEFVSCGEFVPICTRRVFLKYFTDAQPSSKGETGKYSLAFWTNEDANNYLEEIRKKLEPIFTTESEEEQEQ